MTLGHAWVVEFRPCELWVRVLSMGKRARWLSCDRDAGREAAVAGSEVRYAKDPDGVHIAYQVIGSGPPDVVYANSFMSHIEVSWEYPRAARFYERMAAFSRLVLFDRRGTGLSDPMVGPLTSDDRVADLTAVMDAVGLEEAVLLGSSEGAAACAYFAGVYPERVAALVLFSPFVGPFSGEDVPWAWTTRDVERLTEHMENSPSGEVPVGLINPSITEDPDALEWYRRYFRLSASPALAEELIRRNLEVDLRDILPAIRVPTLVLHRTDETWLSVEYARHVARTMTDAQLVEVPGTDHYIWEENAEQIVAEIEEFLTGVRTTHEIERSVRTMLVTDIVASTDHARALGDTRWRELLDRQQAAVERQITRFGGRLIKNTGDGVLVTFDGPARGIRCAIAIRETMRALGLKVRSGVHTGEVELRGDDIGGIAVHLAARISALAGAGEILTSRTLKDLTAGSGLVFEDRGVHTLKGVPDEWQVYAIAP